MPRPRIHDPDRLLDVAEQLIAERGPEEVTVRALAVAAGVPNSTIYHSFGSLPALLARAWLRGAGYFLDVQTQLVDRALAGGGAALAVDGGADLAAGAEGVSGADLRAAAADAAAAVAPGQAGAGVLPAAAGAGGAAGLSGGAGDSRAAAGVGGAGGAAAAVDGGADLAAGAGGVSGAGLRAAAADAAAAVAPGQAGAGVLPGVARAEGVAGLSGGAKDLRAVAATGGGAGLGGVVEDLPAVAGAGGAAGLSGGAKGLRAVAGTGGGMGSHGVADSPAVAAVVAAADTPAVVAGWRPGSARLMLTVSPDRILGPQLPGDVLEDLRALDKRLVRLLVRLARELWQRGDGAAVEVVTTCVVDLPTALLKRDLAAYGAAGPEARKRLAAAVRAVLALPPPDRPRRASTAGTRTA
ncbi:helix-turn-helix domain-containing protein [Amycolatopsis saalfeldensis]|uniref:DNA-binding transcriptional regulator, AcrR family n=1 Tax=Amycolatopsis saalfeldensis TaxID=394193 RepID=A0A1H8YLH8_9PSEU|nr:DNA-binding transcriptional regulator, AcrR family [Amycolatopsis saalfeldensis]